ncbi:MAG: hypothetical protein JXA57_13190, partial [Armatimonadetes bacterium]|nr:hypothetical protein [Armatimonadota bacterium]
MLRAFKRIRVRVAALRWLTAGYSYEIIGLDVLGAYDRTMKAAANAGRGLARLLTSAPLDSERTRSAAVLVSEQRGPLRPLNCFISGEQALSLHPFNEVGDRQHGDSILQLQRSATSVDEDSTD